MDLLQRWKVEGKKNNDYLFRSRKKGEHVMCAEVEGKKMLKKNILTEL